MKWTPDHQAETRLAAFHLKPVVANVSISDISVEDSLKNHARSSGQLNQEAVLDFASAMERGDEFPKIILLKRRGQKYLVLSGNHRLAAAMLVEASELPAYVVETTDAQVIDMLPRVLNRLHGQRSDRDEAIIGACYAVREYGYEIRQAAKMFGIPESSVANTIRIGKTSETLEKSGVRLNGLAKTSVLALGSIKNENVLLSAARMAASRKFTTGQAQELATSINEQRTEARQMAVIAELERNVPAEKEPGPPVKHKRNVRTSFLIWLATGEKLLEKASKLSHMQITEAGEAGRIADRLRKLSRRCSAIIGPGGAKSTVRHHTQSAR